MFVFNEYRRANSGSTEGRRAEEGQPNGGKASARRFVGPPIAGRSGQ